MRPLHHELCARVVQRHYLGGSAFAAPQVAPPRACGARVRRGRARALWPLCPAPGQLGGAQRHGCAGALCVDSCGISGRNAGGCHLAARVACATAGHAPAAHPRHGHGPGRGRKALAAWRCAGMAALGHARRRGALSAAVSPRHWRADGDGGLAESDRCMPAPGRAPGVGQRPLERQVLARRAAAGPFGAAGLPGADGRVGTVAGRCRAAARPGCAGARGVWQPEI